MLYKYSIQYLQEFAYILKPCINDIKIIEYNNIKNEYHCNAVIYNFPSRKETRFSKNL